MRKFIRLVRYCVRVCLIVRKYAIESVQDDIEQLFNNKEILFDLSKFRRPVEVRSCCQCHSISSQVLQETIGRNIRNILKSDPATRTDDDVRIAVVGLGQTVASFTGIRRRSDFDRRLFLQDIHFIFSQLNT